MAGQDEITCRNLTGKSVAAYGRIKSEIRKTLLEFSPALSGLTGAKVYVKWESEEGAGSV